MLFCWGQVAYQIQLWFGGPFKGVKMVIQVFQQNSRTMMTSWILSRIYRSTGTRLTRLGPHMGKSTKIFNPYTFSFQMKLWSVVLVITFCLMATVSLSSANDCVQTCHDLYTQCDSQCQGFQACEACTDEVEKCRNNCGKRSLHFRLWPVGEEKMQ